MLARPSQKLPPAEWATSKNIEELRDRAGRGRGQATEMPAWILRHDDEPDRDAALELKAAWLEDACELIA
jgi:hypothetical protein